MITLLVMIHIITSHQGHLQNKNLLDKQIHVGKIWGLMIPFTGQKHAHSDTNNVDGERKRRRVDTSKKYGCVCTVVTEKPNAMWLCNISKKDLWHR